MLTRWAPPGASHHARMGPLRSFGSRGPSLAFAVALLGCLLLAALPSPASGTYDRSHRSGDKHAYHNHYHKDYAKDTNCSTGGETDEYGGYVVDPAVLVAMGAQFGPDGTCWVRSVTGQLTEVSNKLRGAQTCSGGYCADLEVGACRCVRVTGAEMSVGAVLEWSPGGAGRVQSRSIGRVQSRSILRLGVWCRCCCIAPVQGPCACQRVCVAVCMDATGTGVGTAPLQRCRYWATL